jgi:hypothetical protein
VLSTVDMVEQAAVDGCLLHHEVLVTGPELET